MRKKLLLALGLFVCCLAINAQMLKQTQVTNLNNAEIQLPDFGKKTLFVIYLDPDAEGITDELTEAINKQGFPPAKLGALGVVNCKDTWIPNKAIITKAHFMQKRYSKSEILLDKEFALKKAWSLGDCDNLAVIMIVGQNGKMKYLHKVKSKDEAKYEIPVVIKRLNLELK